MVSTESFSKKVVTTFRYKKAAYLPAGCGRHSKSLEINLDYVLTLRPLLTAKNLLLPTSLGTYH